MLAYSSLEHVGLICTGIAMNTPITIFGALLHMGYHALTKPVLFFAAGNIHQTFHSLEFRIIGPGVVKVLPVTALLMGLAAAAAVGLPPFGLFFSELTIISGGISAGKTTVSVLILLASHRYHFAASSSNSRGFCPACGNRFKNKTDNSSVWRDVPAMALLLGILLVFSVWLPAPLLQEIRQAADIIGGRP